MIQRIYIDTSIIGGYFDEEFQEVTKRLFNRFQKGEIIFVISDLLELELLEAPEHVRKLLLNYFEGKFEKIELTEEAIKLADYYIAERELEKRVLKIAGILLWQQLIK